MSSRPKIVVAPKKKKKKPLVILNKKSASGAGPSSASSSAATAGGRPASPNTVAAAAGDASSSAGGAGAGIHNEAKASSKGKKAKSGGTIRIQPFAQPPALPPDFYASSLAVLRRALTCVLRHEALTVETTSGGGKDGSRGTEAMDVDAQGERKRLVGREELYRSVEDLCVHKFGTKLYDDVVRIMEGAAGEVVRRLAHGSGCRDETDESMVVVAAVDGAGRVGYDAARLVSDLNLKGGGCTYDPSRGGDDDSEAGYAEKRYALLRRMHAVCRAAYAEEYLTFVRSIFLALDRAHVYLADVALEEIGADSTSVPGGTVLDRTSAGGGSFGSNARVWGLWEVGIACLRGHMVRPPVGVSATETPMLPVLTALVLTTAHAILSEYDDREHSIASSSAAVAMGDARPLVRNCVRTCVDLGALPSLLIELILAASARFAAEGRWWTAALAEARRTAPEYLRHVERRLKQSAKLAGEYLPATAAAGAALRRLATVPHLVGAVPVAPSAGTTDVAWSPADHVPRRILPAIIEKQLLGPHLVPAGGILDPRHLYPLLDDDDGDSTSGAAWKAHHAGGKAYANAQRLYGLCWRMAVSSAAPPVPSSTTPQTALDHLRKAFGEYGRLRGAEIVRQGPSAGGAPGVNGKEMEKKVVPDLLAFKRHLSALHAGAFRSEDAFGATVRSILEDVLNGATASHDADGDGGRRIAELLAKQVDARFKDTKAQAAAGAATTADANEAFQGEILALFRHIHSKDVFEAFYKRDLAKRLLTGRAVSTDMEKSFLSKLKAECGPGYTSKMEGMFKDMDLSRDIMGSYAAYTSQSASGDAAGVSGKAVDMDVQVLTTGYWPVYPKYPNIILTPEMLAQRTKFEKYYSDKYQGRRIAWQYSLGNCIVKASFPKSAAPKELIVNVCQSLALLCFQQEDGPDGKGLTLDDIAKKTGIEDRGELERVLQSLSMGREGTRVLRKVDYDSPTEKAAPSPSKGGAGDSPRKRKLRLRRNVGPHDRFLFNSAFTSNQRRIRITNITMKETSEERTKTHAAVSKDRLYFIDAAVVRIMKARKTIEHRDLIGEVMAQLKFPATSADIKKRVESLIEREYMEREEGDRSRYKYLA